MKMADQRRFPSLYYEIYSKFTTKEQNDKSFKVVHCDGHEQNLDELKRRYEIRLNPRPYTAMKEKVVFKVIN